MKLYWNIPSGLKGYYHQELDSYKSAFQAQHLQEAWHHLERAHILGQAYPIQHSYVHWKMLQFGFAIKSWKEIKGQILRLVFGGVLSFVGKVPRTAVVGTNTLEINGLAFVFSKTNSLASKVLLLLKSIRTRAYK